MQPRDGPAEGEQVEEEQLPGRAAAPEWGDAEDAREDGADQAEADDPLPERHEEVGRLLEPRPEAERLGPQDFAPEADRLQVALRPAGALAEQRPQPRESLLVDGGAQVLAALPALSRSAAGRGPGPRSACRATGPPRRPRRRARSSRLNWPLPPIPAVPQWLRPAWKRWP